jgi:hypothetical protein
MEKKLTAEQVEYVFNYVASKDIKWYELQVELTDHFVSRMEEFWAKDPELTFHQVKQYAENEFGRNGFKAIEEERTQILQKEYKNRQLKMVVEYFKFPKIMGSILLVFLTYKSSFYFDNPHRYFLALFILLVMFCIPSINYWLKNKKNQGIRFLAIEKPYSYLASLSLGFSNLGGSFSNLFREEIQNNYIVLFVFSCFWVLGFLCCITRMHLNNKIIADIKKQYQLT